MRSAPRAISASASALPRDWAADGAPETCSRSMVAPSGLPTRPHTSSLLCCTWAVPATGVRHRPPGAAGVCVRRDGDFRIFARQLATEERRVRQPARFQSRARPGQWRATCALSQSARQCAGTSERSRPHKPGQPRPLAVGYFAQPRVEVPAQGTRRRSGRRALTWQIRRRLSCPRLRDGRLSRVDPSRLARASRTSARAGIAARRARKPLSGHIFQTVNARSISPRESRSISLTHTALHRPPQPVPAIAGGDDDLASPAGRVGCAQLSRHVIGLPQCQDAAPRAMTTRWGPPTIF